VSRVDKSIAHPPLFTAAATEFENKLITIEFHDNGYINYCVEYRTGDIQQKVVEMKALVMQ
jgi:hypothetical protein